MDLYEGIYLRKSIRQFRMEKLDDKTLENILNFTAHLDMLDGQQQVQFEIVETKEDKNVPYYLVLTSQKADGHEMNAGFLMQQVMLYLMSKGLGSCFMKYKKQPIRQVEGFEPLIMLAFGRTDKSIYRETRNAKRLPLKELCCFKNAVTEDVKIILDAGRLAPSSFNSQPWRFVVYENRIHLFCKKAKGPFWILHELQKLDVGIALANMYLAAEELWYSIEITKLENIKEHPFQNNEYLISFIFQK